MGIPSVGTVVLIRFPYSNLSNAKLRPAIVLASASRGDLIVCQVTNNEYGDPAAVGFNNADLRSGSLRVQSFARPSKLFTASPSILVRSIAELKDQKQIEILKAVIGMFEGSLP